MLPQKYSSNTTTKKILLTGFLILLFIIPLKQISSLTDERAFYRKEALESIATSWAGKQDLFGPILVVPYTEKVATEEYNAVSKNMVSTFREVSYKKAVAADTLKVTSHVTTELRYRGIYEVPLYTVALDIEADFKNLKADLAAHKAAQKNEVTYGKPYLLFRVSDMRGVGGDLSIAVNGQDVSAVPGSMIGSLQGFHVPLDTYADSLDPGVVKAHMTVKGIESVSFAPTAKNAVFTMESEWPHPRFEGRFLPSRRDVSEKGFSAEWTTTALATDVESHANLCVQSGDCAFTTTTFGVSFFQPVDVYQQTTRSVKYGILFILITFIAFFAIETTQRLRIHPVQYLLVGADLVIFYLLLLSLSEHMAFGLAYTIAMIATLGLLWFYMGHVVRSEKIRNILTGFLAAVYAMIYVILMSHDFALLMGSGLVFAVLALLMVMTRNVNWYALEESDDSEKTS